MALLSEASALVAPFYVADDALEIAEDARAQLKDDADKVLATAIGVLEGIDDTGTGVLGSESGWNAAAIEAALRTAIVDGLGIKPKFAFGPLRTAVSGQRISPPLFESMEILGKTSTLTRLRRLARGARRGLEGPIWERVTGAGSIAARFTVHGLTAARQ